MKEICDNNLVDLNQLDSLNSDNSENLNKIVSSVSTNTLNQKENILLIENSQSTYIKSNDTLSRDTYKNRKKIYQKEKKKLVEQLLTTLNDPTVLVLNDWLKVRTTFKAWNKVWCELRPGLLVIYKSPKVHKSGQWIGTVLLNICNVIERPSKKDGFCFKLFNSLDQNIWASRGPKGESYGAITLPLPLAYLMFRATSQAAGNRWMQSIKVSLHCSKQIITNDLQASKITEESLQNFIVDYEEMHNIKDENEIEKHFIDQDLTDDQNSSGDHEYHSTDSDITNIADLENLNEKRNLSKRKVNLNKELENNLIKFKDKNINTKQKVIDDEQASSNQNLLDSDQTEYIWKAEDFKLISDEQAQVEEVGDENKSLLWSLLKQVKPGMDLSKVVLPTFILEPRSFLEKITDYYYHCDILANASLQTDPFERMKEVVRWYLSGFYKKPDGLKKPFNPILGECHRCYWEHPAINLNTTTDNSFISSEKSRTYYIAEQISHHPPITAFHVVNRREGYKVGGMVCVRSKFYGNSVSAILDGKLRLSLINRREDYLITLPYAHCKGVLLGGLTFELGGKIEINCELTGYSTELEFKLKPILIGEMNSVHGKIKLGKETLATIDGHWNKLITIKDKKTDEQSILWQANSSTFSQRIKRFIVPLEKQEEYESERLWHKVSEAILSGDQHLATTEKTILEEKQRQDAKYREELNIEYQPKYFTFDVLNKECIYKFEDNRPWDMRTDIIQYEKNFIIQTLTKHPTVRKNSLNSLNNSISNFSVNLSPIFGTKKSAALSSCSKTRLGPIQSSVVKKKGRKSKLNQIEEKNLIISEPKANTLKYANDVSKTLNKKIRKRSSKCVKLDSNLAKTNDALCFDQVDQDQDEFQLELDTNESDINELDVNELDASLNLNSNDEINRLLLEPKLTNHFNLNQNLTKPRKLNKNETNLANLAARQKKLEQLLIKNYPLKTLNNSNSCNFFTFKNLFAVALLTLLIQLAIYLCLNHVHR